MKHSNNLIIALFSVVLYSCGGTTYKIISDKTAYSNDLSFNIKHVLDGCCGCSGVLVNTFQANRLQSQLFLESSRCPFIRTKYIFHYSSDKIISKVDTLIAVSDNTYSYPLTEIDRLALAKVDSFIMTQNSSLYKIRKIDIIGYRNKTNSDNDSLMVLPPRLDKHALN